MLVAEHMIVDVFAGVEKELCLKILNDIKTEESLLAICGVQVLRKSFLVMYNFYPRIETLPDNEKKQLKDFVIRSFPGKSQKELVENCKIIYTAGMMTK